MFMPSPPVSAAPKIDEKAHGNYPGNKIEDIHGLTSSAVHRLG
jgi:hypothetical protein